MRMAITSSGCVGIGCDNPSELLHVQGNACVTGNIITAGCLDVGTPGTGSNVVFNAVTSGCKLCWDATAGAVANSGALCLTDNTALTFGTDGDVDVYYDNTSLTIGRSTSVLTRLCNSVGY